VAGLARRASGLKSIQFTLSPVSHCRQIIEAHAKAQGSILTKPLRISNSGYVPLAGPKNPLENEPIARAISYTSHAHICPLRTLAHCSVWSDKLVVDTLQWAMLDRACRLHVAISRCAHLKYMKALALKGKVVNASNLLQLDSATPRWSSN